MSSAETAYGGRASGVQVTVQAPAGLAPDLFGMQTIGLRFFTVYGPWGRPDMAYWTFTEKILAAQPIELFNHGDMKRDFTYVDDIVDGMARFVSC